MDEWRPDVSKDMLDCVLGTGEFPGGNEEIHEEGVEEQRHQPGVLASVDPLAEECRSDRVGPSNARPGLVEGRKRTGGLAEEQNGGAHVNAHRSPVAEP